MARVPSPSNRRLVTSAESALPLAYPNSPVSSAFSAISAVEWLSPDVDLIETGLVSLPDSPVSSASSAISAVNVSSNSKLF